MTAPLATLPIPDVAAVQDLWCVYEHHVPPAIILVHYCQLAHVFTMREARLNSEWQEIFATGGAVTLHITHVVASQTEAEQLARQRIKSLPVMPRCNLRGFNMRSTTRKVACSNGITYNSQSHAAKMLGLSQGNISRMMRGELASIAGLKFWWKGPYDD